MSFTPISQIWTLNLHTYLTGGLTDVVNDFWADLSESKFPVTTYILFKNNYTIQLFKYNDTILNNYY